MEQSINQTKSMLQTASKQKIGDFQTTEKKKMASLKVGFIDKGSGEHQSNQVYDSKGLCPTETYVQEKQQIKFVEKK